MARCSFHVTIESAGREEGKHLLHSKSPRNGSRRDGVDAPADGLYFCLSITSEPLACPRQLLAKVHLPGGANHVSGCRAAKRRARDLLFSRMPLMMPPVCGRPFSPRAPRDTIVDEIPFAGNFGMVYVQL